METWTLWDKYKKKESELIRIFKEAFPLEWENNIGNDGALLTPSQGKKILITQDLLLEGVHFFPSMPLEALAYKSLMVNLSDIFADGGKPTSILLGLQIPHNRVSDIKEFAKHFIHYAKEYGVRIIGGDTVGAQQLGISVVCVGEVEKAWLRKNAQTGDFIYVTGSLGESYKGLQILKETEIFDFRNPYVKRHCYPPYRGDLVDYLVSYDKNLIRAAVDVSDGFIEDLSQILLESGKSCLLDESMVPRGKNIMNPEALYGGEDYELILCSSHLLDIAQIQKKTGINLSLVGEIIDPRLHIGEVFSKQTGEILEIPKDFHNFFHL